MAFPFGAAQVPPRNRLFSSYTYSAFFSYAERDDRAWGWWVLNFADEFDLVLPPRVFGVQVPNAHMSRRDGGPQSGRLGPELKERIDASFAMILFVHDGYVISDWCLEELKYFKDLCGDAGFRDRLYIIAMSKTAMDALQNKPIWQQEFTGPNRLIWLPFYQDNSTTRPLDQYFPRGKKMMPAPDFYDRLLNLRDDLAVKIKRKADEEGFVPTFPLANDSRRDTPKDEYVRVYIEGYREQNKHWETLGQQVGNTWTQVVKDEPDEPPLRLRPTGLPLNELEQRPSLDDANGVVLLWDRKTPDSLAAQISQVEPKLSGPHFAPGLVAYMMQGDNDMPGSATINNWPVVRFSTSLDHGATVLPADEPALATFLKRVLAHKRRA